MGCSRRDRGELLTSPLYCHVEHPPASLGTRSRFGNHPKRFLFLPTQRELYDANFTATCGAAQPRHRLLVLGRRVLATREGSPLPPGLPAGPSVTVPCSLPLVARFRTWHSPRPGVTRTRFWITSPIKTPDRLDRVTTVVFPSRSLQP